MQQGYQPYSCSDLKSNFKTAKESLDNNFFPEQLLNEFADYIDWVVEQGPQNTVYPEPELKKFFFEEFISGIAKRVRDIKQLPDQYLPIVSRLFLSIGELFGQEVDRDNSDMADAVRYLFEQNCALHQNLFQSEESSLLKAFHDPQLAQRLPEEERFWRQSLSVGSRVDAVKRDNEHNLKVWAKATVINVEDDLIQLVFDNDSSLNSVYQWWYSPELARLNSRTADDEWRYKLEVGDVIDCHDAAKVWYASTVIQKQVVQDQEDRKFTKLQIGFRIFDEEGDKQDDQGRGFIGWPSTFDEWIIASSPRIQKYKSQAKDFEEANSFYGRQLEETFEDQLDMLLYSKMPEKPVYGVIRQKCRSGLLVTFLNRLGTAGTFKKILDKINQDNYDQLSLETVFYYLDAITNCYIMFNKAFVNDYFPALFLAIKKKILSSSEASLRNFRKERVDTLIQYLFNIMMTRIMPYQVRENEKNMLSLDIGCYFLTLNFLEKRIDGAKLISEVCKSTTLMTFQASIEVKQNQSDKLNAENFLKSVLEKLRQQRVLYQMFSKERAHQQLVERGEEVLKLMISQGEMTADGMELVWSATKLDETTQLELYKLFNELASILKIKEINFIIDQLSQVPLVKVLKEQVDLVYEIGKRARSGDQEYGHKAVEYMWRLAIPQLDSIDKIIVNKASIAIVDIIKTWDNSRKITLFNRIIESLKNNQEGFLCIKMITKLLRDFQGQIMQKAVQPEDQRGEDAMDIDQENSVNTSIDNKFENKSKFINYLEENMHLMIHFFLNFKHYMLKARQGLRAKLAGDTNISSEKRSLSDSVLAERFCHSDQLNERIEFLKFIGVNSAVKISKLHLSILWDELVKYQMFQEDSDLFYKFIKDVCEMFDSGIVIVELDDIIQFFQEFVFRSDADESIYRKMTLEGFNSVYSFFMLLNQKNRKIVRLMPMNPQSNVQQYPPAPKMTSYNNITGGSYQNFSFNKNKDTEEDPGFHILVAPWELDGIETIWKIVTSTATPSLITKVTQFLIKLYTSVSFNLNSRIPEFEDSYLENCIKGIVLQKEAVQSRDQPIKDVFEKVEKPYLPNSTITKTVTQRVQPPEESKILRYLNLIKELISNSEIFGTRGVRSHNGIFRGSYLDCLQVSNSIKNGTKYVNKFEIGVQSNITLFELRKILGQRVSRVYSKDNSVNYIQEKPCHPYSVRIYRYTGSFDIPEKENGKTLRELKFKRNEQLSMIKNNVFSSSRVSLMNPEKNDLSDHAKSLFKEQFSRFALFKDPLDPQSKLVLDREAVKQFISICADTIEVKDDDDYLQLMFKDYDPDQDGFIEEKEFMKFWKNSVFDSEQIVWQNIFNLGYRYDLLPQALDGEDPEIYQKRQSIEVMPRYKLAANQVSFNSIFSLVETMNPDVANAAWSLIKTISTNPILYKKVLALDRDPNFNWVDIFDMNSINKMLYVLQIVEALIDEQSFIKEQAVLSSDEDTWKQDWFERFMTLGGFQQILKMFHKSLEILSNQSADHMNKFEKNFIEQMLRLIKIFIISAYSSSDDDQDVMQVLELVRSKSKTEETGATATTSTEKQQEEFKTPSKNVKGKFAQRLLDKRVQFSNNDDIEQPEITTEFLFGDQDISQKVLGESKPQNAQTAQIQNESAQKHNIEEEQMKKFKALANIIKQSGLNTDILSKIDFVDLQSQILELISMVLSKHELAEDDSLIIENALGLWLATLIKNGSLINDFYSFKRPKIISIFSIKNVEELIVNGLFTYKSPKVRNDFAQTIRCIAQKVVNPAGLKPVLFFLDVFKRSYPKQDYYFMWSQCKNFFETFTFLIEECLKNTPAGAQPEVDVYDILYSSIVKFKHHPTQESKGSVIEDKTLIGYLQMIERTLQIIQENGIDKDKMESVVKETGILEELFYEHLFFNPRSLVQSDNKSKCKESRIAAYSLLQKFMEVIEPHILAEFLEEKLWDLIKDMKRPKDWKFVPSENQRSVLSSSQNFVGIVNLGCICYMNSMMQQFFMVPQFRYQLLRAVDNSPQDLKEYKGYMINDNLLLQLQLMFANLELSERQAFYPLGFCFAFKDFDGNPTNTAIQQDAQEFLGIFFARLEELLKPTCQKHLLDNVFGGKVCSQLKCPECGNIRNRLETFFTLSVAVRDRTGLNDSLQKMIESSIINDFKCENCQKKVDVEKRQLIAEPPNVLIVHLQRIQFNFDTFQNEKINSHFDFPNLLDLKDYSFKKIMKNEGHSAEILEHDDVKHLSEIADDEYIYKLVGVTIHRGTAEHGHYYSLINTKRGKDEVDETKSEWYQTERDPWKVFDDENVKHFNFNDLRSEAFGGSSSSGYGNDNDLSAYYQSSGTANSYGQSAYMLVYEKMKKKPVKEVYVPEKKEADTEMEQVCASGPSSEQNNMQIDDERKASLEGIDTAHSRVNVQSPIDKSAAPSVSILDSYLTDPSNGEKFKWIPYKSIGSFVPDWMKGQILHDNQTFLIDRHIYHEQFFNFVKNTLRHIANHTLMTQHQYKFDYLHNFHKLKRVSFQIAQKVLFDMLSFYMYNTSMSDITSSMQTVMTFSDSPYTFSKGDPSILHQVLQNSYMQDNCQHFLAIMLMCPDKTSRFYSGRFTSLFFNKIYQIYSETLKKGNQIPESLEALKQDADKVLCLFIKTLKSPECSKNWQKIDQFLQMIYNIVNESMLQQEVLLQNFEIVTYLLDFLLANVNMKISSKMSTFDPIVGMICQFTRFSLTPAMRLEYHMWVPENQEGMKPPASLLGFDAATMATLPERYPLKDESLDYILSSELVDLCLKEGVQCVELGKMIAHLCYKFDKFSKKISKTLLHGISRGDFEKVKSYLDVVTQIALIKDQFQQNRLEWMFGIPILNSITASTSITNDPNEVLTRIGVGNLHSINDEVYQYKSALIQDSVDDSLLHLLWRYKSRLDTYTVNCIYGLLNLISLDDYVAEFFSKIPSPTYCYARYTDWFLPYLEKQLNDIKKGYQGNYSQQKEEIIVKCISLYEKYSQTINKSEYKPEEFKISYRAIPDLSEDAVMSNDYHINDEEENIRNLISPVSLERGESEGIVTKVYPEVHLEKGNVFRTDPQPYVITGCMNERLISENNYENVLLQIYALGCTYTQSLPTGETNLAIPNNVFRRPVNNTSNYQQVRIVPMQTEMENSAVKNVFQSTSLASKVDDSKGRRGGILINKNADVWDERQEEEYRTNQDFKNNNEDENPKIVINDGDDQWELVNNKDSDQASYDSYDFKGINEVDVQEEIDRYNNQNSQQAYPINVIEEGQDDYNNNTNHQFEMNQPGTFITNNENDGRAAQHNQNVFENEEITPKELQDSNNEQQYQPQAAPVIWPNEVKYCDDLVYRIQVINYRDSSIKCSINFSEIQEMIEYSSLNLVYPKGGFKCTVQPHSTKTFIILHKLKPNNSDSDDDILEIQKINTDFRFKERYTHKGNSYNIYDRQNLNTLNEENINIRHRPPKTRDDIAKVHPAQSRIGASAGEAAPLINRRKVNKEIDDDGIPEDNEYDSDQADKNFSCGRKDADYFDSNAALQVDDDSKKGAAPTNNSQLVKNGVVQDDHINQRECPQCTFLNDLGNAFCEICTFEFN